MANKFTVTGALTPANPTTGQTMTVTISGDNTVTSTVAGTIGPLVLRLAATGGATSDLTIAASTFTQVITTHETVKLVGITDPSGRVWTVAANGLSATAVA